MKCTRLIHAPTVHDTSHLSHQLWPGYCLRTTERCSCQPLQKCSHQVAAGKRSTGYKANTKQVSIKWSFIRPWKLLRCPPPPSLKPLFYHARMSALLPDYVSHKARCVDLNVTICCRDLIWLTQTHKTDYSLSRHLCILRREPHNMPPAP